VFRDDDGLVHLRPVRKASFKSGQPKTFSIAGQKGQMRFDHLQIDWTFVGQRGDTVLRQRDCEFFDMEKIGRKIILRHWKVGDRFQPIGARTATKLQNLFTNLKIPRNERHERIVATTGRGEIFWVEGLRISERFKLDKQSERRLKWQWQRL
jgi:tRNA(Ile)-lysidine synthase